jgi:hypothetical protein
MASTTQQVGTQGTLGTISQNTIVLETLTGVSISSRKNKGGRNVTSITFLDHSILITDALSYFGEKIFTFPEGLVAITAAVGSLTFTTTSILANTLNASVTCAWGFGSAIASNVTLSSTMVNIVGSTAFTSSATISVANTATTGVLAVPININGTATAVPCYFNVGIPTNTDIDADATVLVNGTVTFEWELVGDV